MANRKGRPEREELPDVDADVVVALDTAKIEDDILAAEAQLEVVARCRAKAEADRSWVATRGLGQDERALQEKVRGLRAERMAELGGTEEALVAELQSAIAALPAPMRRLVLGPFAGSGSSALH